jgi:hypothetical protein
LKRRSVITEAISVTDSRKRSAKNYIESRDEYIDRRWVDVDTKFTDFLRSHDFEEKNVCESYYLPKEKRMECILEIHNAVVRFYI